ncbi:sigma-54-dependent Fis family transcriptional regulator [Trujillonella humicola]|uniref:sigma-54-dependent Fis family transcriptional regulator n=1 Tax=Trujillonella humicola TaxID=3383699 RepID=UPI003906325F
MAVSGDLSPPSGGRGRRPVLRTGEQGGADAGVARARASFLDRETVAGGEVRGPILASWVRSRTWRVRPDRLELPFELDLREQSLLTRAAGPVLADVADLFAAEPVSVILCDADGVVRSRLTGDSGLEQHLDRIWLAPGFSYAERFVGTNGIGTALEARGPAHVFGPEHYVERLAELACAGVPVRHPVSGKVLGVLDLTCWRSDAGPLLVATAATLGRRIEQALLAEAGRRELAVLNGYLVACRRNRGAVLAVGEDLLMMNDRARELLDPAEREALLAEAGEAMAGGQWRSLVVDLPGGRAARVTCRPTLEDGGVVGGVLDVALLDPDPAAAPRPAARARPVAGRVAVGSGAAWSRCVRAVERAVDVGEWLVLEGEPGSGRRTLARAAHASRPGSGRLVVVEPATPPSRWLAEVAEELGAGAGTVVLADVDRLPPAALAQLSDLLEPYGDPTDPGRPWVAVTVPARGGQEALETAGLLPRFPRTVQVPPLRHHLEDVPELVPHLLRRLAAGTPPTCTPEVLRVFTHNRWPGNVAQLVEVLRKVLGRRRAGVIEPADLPPECRTQTRRVLTPLENLECDAIVEALLDSRGSKVEAARRLAMSRATIYRKIRDYGISVPVPAGSAPGR